MSERMSDEEFAKYDAPIFGEVPMRQKYRPLFEEARRARESEARLAADFPPPQGIWIPTTAIQESIEQAADKIVAALKRFESIEPL